MQKSVLHHVRLPPGRQKHFSTVLVDRITALPSLRTTIYFASPAKYQADLKLTDPTLTFSTILRLFTRSTRICFRR
ncbi:hypothetical protein QQF64_026391 [Cirrhinus molitorella]|uniref:Uncharacterized protein n=1 Tax=Cirrhinus molitorella TaxID=172907 RepID=A0ABR3N9Q0_9TELE